MNPEETDSPSLRKLLAELLRSDSDFDAFCLDAFPDIYRRFSRGMERVEKENLLLLHAPSRDDVAAALRKRVPKGAAAQCTEAPTLPKAQRRVSIVVAGLLVTVLLSGSLWRVGLSPITRKPEAPASTRATLASYDPESLC